MHLRRSLVARLACGGISVAGLIFAPVALAQKTMPPLPPPRPDASAPPEKPAEGETPSGEAPTGDKAAGADTTDAACLERLTSLGLRFEAQPPVREDVCTIQSPVLVSALPNGVELTPPSLMACTFAEELARWSNDVVRTEAERHLKSSATKLLIGTSYQCRAQRSGGKLSEHAYGNGVDVMGFEFAGRGPLTVGFKDEGSPESAFQSAIRTGACPIFTTVLGPGSDEAHDDHLHLDSRERKGDYRICQ